MHSNDNQAHYEAMLLTGAKIPVLNSGFIRLVDKMGDDMALLQAASFSSGNVQPILRSSTLESDYMAHQAIIESFVVDDRKDVLQMCEIKLHICMPLLTSFYFMEHWQGCWDSVRADIPPYNGEEQLESLEMGRARDGYANVVGNVQAISAQALMFCEKFSIPSGLGMLNITLGHYRQGYFKTDTYRLLQFLAQTLKVETSHEIKQYAEVIATMLAAWMPMLWAAFVNKKMPNLLED